MMEKTRYDQVRTELRCPLCGGVVELGIREKGYYGHVERKEDVPDGASIIGHRRFANGKTRYNYRFPGYVPHCENKECFLHSVNKAYRSMEDAKQAWIEKVILR